MELCLLQVRWECCLLNTSKITVAIQHQKGYYTYEKESYQYSSAVHDSDVHAFLSFLRPGQA